jgi:hypothetical protein
MKSREYRRAFEDLAPEFALARPVIEARVRTSLTRSNSRKGLSAGS